MHEINKPKASGEAMPDEVPLIAELNRSRLSDHPYFATIGSDLGGVYALMSNARAFSARQPYLYSSLIARLEDPRAQSILARQLNDELGNGDPDRIHTRFYDRLLEVFKPFGRPHSGKPGKELVVQAEKIMTADDPDFATGTFIASEIRSDQFQKWMGKALQSQTQIDLSKLEWIVQHQEAEPGHAADSARLFSYLPTEARKAAAARGARAFDGTMGAFLDAMLKEHTRIDTPEVPNAPAAS